ncbi:uncharacterized protein LOC106011207 [Aplysia californica]|uniref:Uncharacterized protein LOC106011207 n=1 Tax=Aplysia californica TaxID=6500 RepID=A0ABM0ZVL9_APLCA|nr:uncharacterized protein LOC106011207 [Aplysia californica]
MGSLSVEQIEFYVSAFVTLPLALLGLGANVINAIIFLKQGAQDCVSVCLLALSLSDFASVLNGGVAYLYNVLVHLDVVSIIDPVAFNFVMSYGCAMFYDLSQGIVAFVTVERCLCVAMPLKFRDIFTFRRSVLAMTVMYAFTIAAYVPHLVTSGLSWRRDPSTNTSRVTLWLSENRAATELYLKVFIYVTMPTVYQVVVLLCTYVMINGLQRSSKFREGEKTRKKAAGPDGSAQTSHSHMVLQSPSEAKTGTARTQGSQTNSRDTRHQEKESHPTNEKSPAKCSKKKDHERKGNPRNVRETIHHETTPEQTTNSRTTDTSFSHKNRRVIKTVSVLAVIFLVANTVRLVIVYAYIAEPGLGYGYSYHDVVVFLNVAVFLFQTMNSSANILVYYHFNASFRNMLRSTFCTGEK